MRWIYEALAFLGYGVFIYKSVIGETDFTYLFIGMACSAKAKCFELEKRVNDLESKNQNVVSDFKMMRRLVK